MLMSRSNAAPRQAGFSLLEVLVAMVILALGLLGVAGLQAVSMRNAHSGYLRSQATILAYDMVERMRANATLARAGSYNVDFVTMLGNGQGLLCGTQQSPANDVLEWKDCLAVMLPNGDGKITVDIDSKATIQVQWQEKVATGGAYTLSTINFTTQTKI